MNLPRLIVTHPRRHIAEKGGAAATFSTRAPTRISPISRTASAGLQMVSVAPAGQLPVATCSVVMLLAKGGRDGEGPVSGDTALVVDVVVVMPLGGMRLVVVVGSRR